MAIFESSALWAVHLSYNVWKLNTISVFASYLFEVRYKFKQVHYIDTLITPESRVESVNQVLLIEINNSLAKDAAPLVVRLLPT